MSSLSISAAWDETRSLLARDGRLYFSVALALILLPQVVLAVAGSPVAKDATAFAKAVYAVVFLLGIVAQIALCRLALQPPVTVGDAIIGGLTRLIPVVAVVFAGVIALALIAAIVALGFTAAGMAIVRNPGQASPAVVALLFVLGAFGSAIFQLIFPVAAGETGNPVRLVTRTWQLARGHYLRLLGFVGIVIVGLVLVVVATQAGVGSIVFLIFGQPTPGSMSALILGLFAGLVQAGFTIVTAVMLARIYVQLSSRADVQPSVPSSGT